MPILTIESTCDETAAAVIDDDGSVLGQCVATQVALHERFHGVVPEGQEDPSAATAGPQAGFVRATREEEEDEEDGHGTGVETRAVDHAAGRLARLG